MAQSVEFDSGGDGTVLAVPQKQSEPIQVRQPLLSEILTRVHKAKHTKDKEKILKEEDCQALRQILKWNFDPNIQTELPEGTPPYVANEAPEGTEHMLLRTEGNKLYNFIKGANTHQSTVRERMFIRLLEGLHKDEARMLCLVKDKKLGYDSKTKAGIKGLSAPVCQRAFNWDENFRLKGV
tara:strand:+ start:65 stop:607 length:543 start_codon:yes stop_codon:yes gene_type:complete